MLHMNILYPPYRHSDLHFTGKVIIIIFRKKLSYYVVIVSDSCALIISPGLAHFLTCHDQGLSVSN